MSALLNLSSSDSRCFGVSGAALGAALLMSTLGGCWRGKPQPLPEGDPGRPDIVLISIDTLRADHLQSYGHFRKTSPWFDQLAASVVLNPTLSA